MKKHILCLGDSNTHGYCVDPTDCADGGSRFNEDERWTCLLQKSLGEDYLIIEEGLSGRTSVFPDSTREGMDTLPVLVPLLLSHEPIDLLIIMLGSNDTKDHLSANPTVIAMGIDRLVKKAKATDCWGGKNPNILVIAPPHIGRGMVDATMGITCAEKSEHFAEEFAPVAANNGCAFLDAHTCTEISPVDWIHLTKKGHSMMAEKLAELVPTLV